MRIKHRNSVSLTIAFAGFCMLFGGCGGSETKEVEVTTYDASVDDRMKERGAAVQSESDRRKEAQSSN